MKVRSPDSSDTLKNQKPNSDGGLDQKSLQWRTLILYVRSSARKQHAFVCERLNYTLYDSQHCLRKPGMKSGRSKSR